MPKLSICIPAYNNVESLKRCIESIFIQTFQDYEIIITDDSNNLDVCMYINDICCDKIHYYKNKIQLGSPENWNESIRKANTDIIKILHHDDWFTDENSLAILVKLLEDNPESSLAFVSSINFDVINNKIINYNKPKHSLIKHFENTPIDLLKGNFIGAPSATIFRKNENLFFDKETIWFVDIDFYIQILSQNAKLAYNEQEAITIGISNTQITREVENDIRINITEYFYLLQKWGVKKLKDSSLKKSSYDLLKRFNIQNKKDIRNLGYKGALPKDINLLFIKLFLKRIKKLAVKK
ncbi:glycosyltransferase family 2 protein [Empedobacter sp. UBA7248]|uniref:glycosyltransferase family 2 protein n=1 Tax=Empedobacter sp. UBA7248 TaxID=1946448 RepID=UPI0025B9B54A|nr:glycosyltransferase family 2 protein [Empedobacter sp. UBA7248]